VNDHQLRQVVRTTLSQIAPEADVDALDGDVDLHEQLDIDSMDFLNFVIGINEATGIDIPERDHPLKRRRDPKVGGYVARLMDKLDIGEHDAQESSQESSQDDAQKEPA